MKATTILLLLAFVSAAFAVEKNSYATANCTGSPAVSTNLPDNKCTSVTSDNHTVSWLANVTGTTVNFCNYAAADCSGDPINGSCGTATLNTCSNFIKYTQSSGVALTASVALVGVIACLLMM